MTSDAVIPATSAPRLHRPEAVAIARAFVDLLDGTYDRLAVAGSLRRRLAWTHDIDVVAVPRTGTTDSGLVNVFGEHRIAEVDMLAYRLDALVYDGTITKRLDARGAVRWGPSLKLIGYGAAHVDLFTPDAERFGWILLLRTGPAAFSRQLVVPKGQKTRDGRPGLLPPSLAPRDGWLTERTSAYRLETLDEQRVFELFGLPYLEPWERV
jgi:DNA polymerase/3'-5' exonuclease PolX